MIKDILVNLAVGASRNVAADYAVSVGQALGAHVTAVAFAYDPVLPPSSMGCIPAEYVEAQRRESEKAAADAIASFEIAGRRQGVSADARMLDASLAGASDLFGHLARRFDVSVVGQTEPDKT